MKFQTRFIAVRLPEDAYKKRLKVLAEKQRKDPRLNENMADELHRWTLFVTNLPMSATPIILLKIYSIRWQVELMFKMMKTFMNLRSIPESNLCRSHMSLYLSMITMVLLSLIVMTAQVVEISLYKAGRIFARNVREFFEYLNNRKKCAVSWLGSLFAQFALKESRPRRPSTKETVALRLAVS